MKKHLPFLLLTVLMSACGKPAEQQPASSSGTVAATTPAPAATPAMQAKAFMDQGMAYFEKEDVVNALKSFDNAIKVEPNNGQNFLVLGQIYMRLRNYDKAVDTFNAGTRVDPNLGELFYFLGAANAIRVHMSEGPQAEAYKNEGIAAAQRAVEIFIKEKDEVRLKTSLALLKSLQENGDIGKIPPQVQ